MYDDGYLNGVEHNTDETLPSDSPVTAADAAAGGGSPPVGPDDARYTVYLTDTYIDENDYFGFNETSNVYYTNDFREIESIEYENTPMDGHRAIVVFDHEKPDMFIKTIGIDYRPDGSVETRAETNRLDDGKRTEDVIRYDTEGNIESQEHRLIDADGTIERSEVSYKYYDVGDLRKIETVRDGEDVIISDTKYDYEADGSLIHSETITTANEEDGPVLSKKEAGYYLNGQEQYSSLEQYRQDGSIEQRVDVVSSYDGRSHETKTYFDESGDITYQKLTEYNSAGFPVSVVETVHSSNEPDSIDAPGSRDVSDSSVEHRRAYIDGQGHEHYDTWYSDKRDPSVPDADQNEHTSYIHKEESFTDDDGRHHLIVTFDKDGDGAFGTYNETIESPSSGETITREGFYWTDVGNDDTLIIQKETTEQRRSDGSLESVKVSVFDDRHNAIMETMSTYDEAGEHVIRVERSDQFYSADESQRDVVETVMSIDSDGKAYEIAADFDSYYDESKDVEIPDQDERDTDPDDANIDVDEDSDCNDIDSDENYF